MKKTLLILALATLLIPEMSAIRARKEYALYTQPDGSSFKVKITGDEWSRRITTSDGAAIIRDASGFWCYALADSQGRQGSGICRSREPPRAQKGGTPKGLTKRLSLQG